MWTLLLITGIAAVAAVAFGGSPPAKCPVTGAVLTDAQLADPALRVGDKTFCCRGCVREWLAAAAN